MQIKPLIKEFEELQKKFWDKDLDAICWAWKINNPDICFVFMNPTWKNIASDKNWEWLKAPWLWTKNIWKMFFNLWVLDEKFYLEIKNKKISDRDYDFSEKIYKKISDKNFYITNLSKATQIDARPLPNSVFKNYLELFFEEIKILKPKVIITFWWQVSSIVLWKNIKIWDYRKKFEEIEIGNEKFKVFPVFYPVWQWMRNMWIAKEDVDFIMSDNLK